MAIIKYFYIVMSFIIYHYKQLTIVADDVSCHKNVA